MPIQWDRRTTGAPVAMAAAPVVTARNGIFFLELPDCCYDIYVPSEDYTVQEMKELLRRSC